MFRLSLTLVAAALARGACALCHRVRVRALGAIMCAVAFACKPCCCRQSDHRTPSLRALCRRDDSTWSMTRRAPPAFHHTLQHATEPINLTSHSSTVSGRRASSSRLFWRFRDLARISVCCRHRRRRHRHRRRRHRRRRRLRLRPEPNYANPLSGGLCRDRPLSVRLRALGDRILSSQVKSIHLHKLID